MDIDIKLENEEARKLVETKIDKERTQSNPVYYDGESVTGSVSCRVQRMGGAALYSTCRLR